MNLYLIRHGQSYGNIGISEPDPRLTDLGKEQARFTGKILPDGPTHQLGNQLKKPIDRIFCSPMRRALQTASIIGEVVDMPVTVRPDLYECGGTRPECMIAAQIAEAYPQIQFDPSMPEGPWWPEENEGWSGGIARAKRVVDWLKNTYNGTDESIVLVAHAVFINAVSNVLMNVHPDDSLSLTFNNCSINRFILRPDRTILIGMNEVSHMPLSHQTGGWEDRD